MTSQRGGARKGAGRKPNDKPSKVIRVPTEWIPDIKLGKLERLKAPKANLHLAKTIELIEELERRSCEVTLHNEFMPALTAERRRRLTAQRRAIQENEAIKTLLKNQSE